MVVRQVVASSALPDRGRSGWRRGGEHRERVREARLTVQTRSAVASSVLLLQARRNFIVVALLIVGLELRVAQVGLLRQRCAVLVLLAVQIHFVLVLHDELR